MILPILTIPQDEVNLRQQSKPISLPTIATPAFQKFVDDLVETARHAKTPEGWESAGLAAIQVGNPVRVFVEHNFRRKIWEIFINPSLELLGQVTDVRVETCLSIPGIIAPVKRHKRIRLTFIDREGKSRKEDYDGFQARVMQHEFDHLNGVLFTDLVSSS